MRFQGHSVVSAKIQFAAVEEWLSKCQRICRKESSNKSSKNFSRKLLYFLLYFRRWWEQQDQ